MEAKGATELVDCVVMGADVRNKLCSPGGNYAGLTE